MNVIQKVVVQCSGGIESTTLIANAVVRYGRANVYPIAFDTDSIFWRHRDSIAVKQVITAYQLQQTAFICRMPQFDFLEYCRDDDYEDVGFIPGMKLLFNTASMAFAQRVGASEVWIGNMGDNVFPDETPSCLSANETLYNDVYAGTCGGRPVKLVAPFSGMTKADVLRLATFLNVDLAATVSCGDERLAGGFNCGLCPWCKKRRQGFSDAGLVDPTYYLLDRA